MPYLKHFIAGGLVTIVATAVGFCASPYPGHGWQVSRAVEQFPQIFSYRIATLSHQTGYLLEVTRERSRLNVAERERHWLEERFVAGIWDEARLLEPLYTDAERGALRPVEAADYGIRAEPWLAHALLFGGGGAILSGLLFWPMNRPRQQEPKKNSVGEGKPRVRVGKYLMPEGDEATHLLAVGTTKAGKSQTIRSAAVTARKRGEPAIVLDYGAELMRRMYRPEVDRIISWGDARCHPWSPLAEIRHPDDCGRVANAMVPLDGVPPEEKTWRSYGQTYLDAVLLTCLELHHRNERVTTRTMLEMVNRPSELKRVLNTVPRHHPAQALGAKDNDKMLASARATAGHAMKNISGLPLDVGFDCPSIRDWIANSSQSGGWLFLPSIELHRDRGMELAAVVAGIAMSELFVREDEKRRYWVFCDELGQYTPIAMMPTGLSAGRKYGVAIVAAVQSTAQLRANYQREEAATMLACFASKAIYKQGDAESADWAVAAMGKHRVKKVTESENSSSQGGSSGYSVSEHIEEIMTSSELLNLSNYSAHIHFSSIPGWHLCQVPAVELGPEIHAPFESRPWEPRVDSPDDEGTESDGVSDTQAEDGASDPGQEAASWRDLREVEE